MKASVITATSQNTKALAVTLYSLICQSEDDFEIIVADDGSRESTWKLIEAFQKRLGKRLCHTWQEAKGKRRSQILNRALDLSHSTKVMVLPEKSFCHRHFVKNHLRALETAPLVWGPSVLLSADLSQEIYEDPAIISSYLLYKKALASKLGIEGVQNLCAAFAATRWIGAFEDLNNAANPVNYSFDKTKIPREKINFMSESDIYREHILQLSQHLSGDGRCTKTNALSWNFKDDHPPLRVAHRARAFGLEKIPMTLDSLQSC